MQFLRPPSTLPSLVTLGGNSPGHLPARNFLPSLPCTPPYFLFLYPRKRPARGALPVIRQTFLREEYLAPPLPDPLPILTKNNTSGHTKNVQLRRVPSSFWDLQNDPKMETCLSNGREARYNSNKSVLCVSVCVFVCECLCVCVSVCLCDCFCVVVSCLCDSG